MGLWAPASASTNQEPELHFSHLLFPHKQLTFIVPLCCTSSLRHRLSDTWLRRDSNYHRSNGIRAGRARCSSLLWLPHDARWVTMAPRCDKEHSLFKVVKGFRNDFKQFGRWSQSCFLCKRFCVFGKCLSTLWVAACVLQVTGSKVSTIWTWWRLPDLRALWIWTI